MLQRERHASGGQPVPRSVGPLDQHERPGADDLVEGERIELVGSVEAIEIEVVHRRAWGLVLVHQREGGTRDLPGHSVALADGLHERRLPCAELARQRDHDRWMCRAAEAMSPIAERVPVHGERAVVRQHRDQWLVRSVVPGVLAHRRPPDAESAAIGGRDVLPAMRAFTSNSWSRR